MRFERIACIYYNAKEKSNRFTKAQYTEIPFFETRAIEFQSKTYSDVV